jgi:hypothetical protein
MECKMDSGQWLMIGLCIFLLAWYALGWWYNRRRGHAVWAWLQNRLGELGEISETRWLSPLHSSAQFIVTNAQSPFRKIGVVFVLEPRENFLVWLFRHLVGRRDELYIRAELRNIPSQEFEIGLKGKAGVGFLTRSEKGDAYTVLSGPGGFEIARRGRYDEHGVERLNALLARYAKVIQRLSLQRKSPHLILRAHLGRLLDEADGEFFEALKSLG